MTKIDFYVGKTNSLQARLLLACKVIMKAHQQQMHTYIHTDTATTSAKLDDLLWTFNELAFIPHALAPTTEQNNRILIGHDHEPMENCGLLINLSNEIPSFFSRFERLAEILDQDEPVLHAGRKRYQFYRDRGYNLDYHQLKI
ncbi:DNA polymerase III subunit chi [Thiothrix lacustris]|uniref:DNA polymerase III subunit chi n=1 Tax=Thiothrix lacustris TaxID=525917 RepID=A0ABY9MPW7_9GAMM|nr:DNA polymerase III subunit chi [Thiothrix lacustris]WML90568.1 DNA polymerase III subunit chi [Thiothrix lacustris]